MLCSKIFRREKWKKLVRSPVLASFMSLAVNADQSTLNLTGHKQNAKSNEIKIKPRIN